MGMKITGAGPVANKLERIGEKTNKKALAVVREGGKEIAELAKRMAPVDDGNLEEAIKSEDDESRGANHRKVIVVHVDESQEVSGRPGKKVGDYAAEMHEGVYKLGKKSQEKQKADTSVTVGRKYLERAKNEMEDEIRKKVIAALSGVI